MSSRKELLFARARPLAPAVQAGAFGAGAVGAGAGAGGGLSAEAVGFCSGVSLSCTPRFINRRHLGLKEQFQQIKSQILLTGATCNTLLIRRDSVTNQWFSWGELQIVKGLTASKENKQRLLLDRAPYPRMFGPGSQRTTCRGRDKRSKCRARVGTRPAQGACNKQTNTHNHTTTRCGANRVMGSEEGDGTHARTPDRRAGKAVLLECSREGGE